MKPLIGVFATIEDDGTQSIAREYIEALGSAGAIPLLVAYTEDKADIRELVSELDGFCLSGGLDVDPVHYGESAGFDSVEIHKRRDAFELLAIPELIASGKPILGICRGAQVMNVALGGSLYQDLPSQLGIEGHRQTGGRYEASHEATVLEGTPLAELIGAGRIRINSFHHQAIKRLGDGLCTMAVSDDGVIEAVYREGEQYVRLYQWHPERLIGSDAAERAIFSDFAEACKRLKNNK